LFIASLLGRNLFIALPWSMKPLIPDFVGLRTDGRAVTSNERRATPIAPFAPKNRR
jgi:hypothetical protein